MPSSSTNITNGDISIKQQIIASSTGAFLTSLLMTPMDVVKIRMQSQVRPLAKGECFLFSNGLMEHVCTSCADPAPASKCEWFNRPGHFNGTLDAFVKIARHEGLKSLWSGLSPTIVSAIPATVFYFTIYDNLHYKLRKKFGPNAWYPPLLAGSAARAVSVAVVSPLEMIRTKMQSELLSYKDLRTAIKLSIAQDGYTALWRGLSATFLRDIPFSALYWTCYELFKSRALRSLDRSRTDFLVSFLCGAASGTVASLITQPFDVVKTQQQITLGQVKNAMDCKEGTAFSSFEKPKTMLTIMKEIVGREGLPGLFRGITPRLAKVAPACAIMIGTYEYLKVFFSRRNKQKRESFELEQRQQQYQDKSQLRGELEAKGTDWAI